MRRVRREGVVAGHDVLIAHTDTVGWFHASNAYLRYLCDWMREGVLIIPMDEDKPLTLLSFFTQAVILPPGGEPVRVEDIWQVGAVGREYADAPAVGGKDRRGLRQACVRPDFGPSADRLHRRSQAPRISSAFCGSNARRKVRERQRRHRPDAARALAARDRYSRAAAQLIDIGIQAAYHVASPA